MLFRSGDVEMERDGQQLIITVDMSERHGRSKSGKTEIIATSQGNQNVPGDEGAKIGLNVYCR